MSWGAAVYGPFDLLPCGRSAHALLGPWGGQGCMPRGERVGAHTDTCARDEAHGPNLGRSLDFKVLPILGEVK